MKIRAIRPEDAEVCAHMSFEAHRAVAAAHGHPPEQPSVDFSLRMFNSKVRDPNAWGVLAEGEEGRDILGSIFLNTFPPTPVAVIGPLTVNPSAEGGVGRKLMEAALEEARKRGIENIRLVQSPSHNRSLALYSKLGFEVREPLMFMLGKPLGKPTVDERLVRIAKPNDIPACNRLCYEVHGITREFEFRQAVEEANATVVESAGRITGYAAGIGFRGHAVAETTEDLKALISFAPVFLGPGFFVPIRNGELLRWLLSTGLKMGWPANLMTLGKYKEPLGAFLPSIAF